MKIWTSDGHLVDEALELLAAGEAESAEVQAADSHFRRCGACQAREAEWRELFHALATLSGSEPSPAFDAAVMARVRHSAEAPQTATAKSKALWRRLGQAAVAAAAIWTVAVAGGLVWLQSQVEVTPALLLAGLAAQLKSLLMAGVIKLATLLQVSGLVDLYEQAAAAVPGQQLALALAVMTLLSGIAIWTFYRAVVYQPSGVERHV